MISLVIIQRPRFQQNPVRHNNFADIVQGANRKMCSTYSSLELLSRYTPAQ